MSIIEGKKAPAFTLPDENGEEIKLSDVAGKWLVLYFYPRSISQLSMRLVIALLGPRDPLPSRASNALRHSHRDRSIL